MASPYEPPVSVWEVVRKTLSSDQEKMFMREILGETLVDQTVELHAEVDNLLEIWREFRAETTTILTSSSSPLSSSSSSSWSNRGSLPEPPEVRFRLKKEIQFYVEALQSKAEKEGRQLEQVLRTFNNNVLQYALESKAMKRPSTGRSQRDGRETPLVEMEVSGSNRGKPSEALRGSVEGLKTFSSPPMTPSQSATTTPSETMQGLNEESAYGEIMDKIREELETEVKVLYRDIDFLQSCLEGESDFRCDSSLGISSEPTLTDLKEERSKLERHLLVDGAAGDAFGGGGGGRGRMMAWEKTTADKSTSKPNLRPGLDLPPVPSSSSPSSSSAPSKNLTKRPLPPPAANVRSSSSFKYSSSSAADPLRTLHPSSSSASPASSTSRPSPTTRSNSFTSSTTPLAAALDSLAPAVFNNVRDAVGGDSLISEPFDSPEEVEDNVDYDVVDEPLGPAARQPFGSTQRVRIRSNSPREKKETASSTLKEALGSQTKSATSQKSVDSKDFKQTEKASFDEDGKPVSSPGKEERLERISSKETKDVRNKIRSKISSTTSSSSTSGGTASSRAAPISGGASSRAAPVSGCDSRVVPVSAVQPPSKTPSEALARSRCRVPGGGAALAMGIRGVGGGGGDDGQIASGTTASVVAASSRFSDAASPDSSLDALLAPTPPPTPPNRNAGGVSSAHAARFRRMVINCREDGEG